MAAAFVTAPWTYPVTWAEIGAGRRRLRLAADETQRAAVAQLLDLPAVLSFEADLMLSPWLDGAEIAGRFDAVVTQECGVSLDLFDAAVSGDLAVRVVPVGSPNAPELQQGEVAVDLDAEDPPDVVEGPGFDVGQYLVEHLALALDPFPRKPGAEFEAPPEPTLTSPFAALAALKRDRESD